MIARVIGLVVFITSLAFAGKEYRFLAHSLTPDLPKLETYVPPPPKVVEKVVEKIVDRAVYVGGSSYGVYSPYEAVMMGAGTMGGTVILTTNGTVVIPAQHRGSQWTNSEDSSDSCSIAAPSGPGCSSALRY